MPMTAKSSSTKLSKRAVARRLPNKRPAIAYLGWASEMAIEFRERAETAKTEADFQWLRSQAKGFTNMYIDSFQDLQPLAEAAAWQRFNGEDISDTVDRLIAGILRLAMMEAFHLNAKNPKWPTVPAYPDSSDTWRLGKKPQRTRQSSVVSS